MKHTLKTTTFLSLLSLLLSGCGYLGSRVGSTEISQPTSQPTSSSISDLLVALFQVNQKHQNHPLNHQQKIHQFLQ